MQSIGRVQQLREQIEDLNRQIEAAEHEGDVEEDLVAIDEEADLALRKAVPE